MSEVPTEVCLFYFFRIKSHFQFRNNFKCRQMRPMSYLVNIQILKFCKIKKKIFFTHINRITTKLKKKKKKTNIPRLKSFRLIKLWQALMREPILSPVCPYSRTNEGVRQICLRQIKAHRLHCTFFILIPT